MRKQRQQCLPTVNLAAATTKQAADPQNKCSSKNSKLALEGVDTHNHQIFYSLMPKQVSP
eukprot:7793816-Karenia_brevis.AAC.1